MKMTTVTFDVEAFVEEMSRRIRRLTLGTEIAVKANDIDAAGDETTYDVALGDCSLLGLIEALGTVSAAVIAEDVEGARAALVEVAALALLAIQDIDDEAEGR